MAEPQLPPRVFATMCGTVDADLVRRVFTGFTLAVNAGCKEVHLLIQSTGGSIGDGVAIYNFLRNLPLQLIAYNGGTVASIAVTVFLAAQERRVSETGNFIIHKSFHTQPSGTADQLELHSQGLKLEDHRTESILRQHLKLSTRQWGVHKRGNLTITATEALKIGLVHKIEDFKPPSGSKLFNV